MFFLQFCSFLVCIGDNGQISSSYKRIASVSRIMTPRSPGRNTFDSVEDSDEEGTDFANDDHIDFYPVNIDSSNNYVSIFSPSGWCNKLIIFMVLVHHHFIPFLPSPSVLYT